MNTKLIAVFKDLSVYELQKGRKFPSMTFKKISGILNILDFEVKSVSQLQNITGFGDSALQIIDEYLKSGKSERHEEAKKALTEKPKVDDSFYPTAQRDSVILDLCKIPGIGEVTAGKLYDYGFRSRKMFIDRMSKVAEGEAIGSSGVTLTKSMKIGMEFMAHTESNRMTVAEHDEIANPIMAGISKLYKDAMVTVAGSRRRGKDTIGDIDIIIGFDGNHIEVLEFCKRLLHLVLVAGDRKVSGIVNRRQVDFRIVKTSQWGSMLLHATGSADFNRMMRVKAIDKGLKLSEYGLMDRTTNEVLASRTEEEIFKLLDMDFVEPKNRSI